MFTFMLIHLIKSIVFFIHVDHTLLMRYSFSMVEKSKMLNGL